MNLADLLDAHPATDETPLLCTMEEERTAGAVRAGVATKAAELRDAGVTAHTAVALQLADGAEFVEWLLAVWRTDAVAVPLNDRLPPTERDAQLDRLRPVVIVDGAGIAPWSDAGQPRAYEPGVAFVLWTSGTAGLPKPILHTHDGYLEIIDRVLAPLRGAMPGPPDTLGKPNVIPVSLALNAGIYNLLFGLRAGAPLVLLGRFEPVRFATLVARYGIRSTVLPPAAMVSLVEETAVTTLEPLRYVRSITAPLSPLQARRFSDRFGVTVLNGYGQAELGEVIGWTAADARAHPDRIGAVGRPHPGVALAIRAEDGQPVETGDVGELWVRPASMAVGYASGEDLADRIDGEGYVRTGDLARIDEAGFVWIEGRVADVINRGGNKVVPEQVEEVLRLDPTVREVAVVGVPDQRLGEVPVAFVVPVGPLGATGSEMGGPHAGGPPVGALDVAALEARCREHLVPYKVPVAFERIDALPRSEVGKVLRRELVERWDERRSGKPNR